MRKKETKVVNNDNHGLDVDASVSEIEDVEDHCFISPNAQGFECNFYEGDDEILLEQKHVVQDIKNANEFDEKYTMERKDNSIDNALESENDSKTIVAVPVSHKNKDASCSCCDME